MNRKNELPVGILALIHGCVLYLSGIVISEAFIHKEGVVDLEV